VEEVADFLAYGIVEHGEMLGSVRKSNIMPRLMFDVVATEQGLPHKLVPEYLATRKEYAGY
jgi:hypothetical protein